MTSRLVRMRDLLISLGFDGKEKVDKSVNAMSRHLYQDEITELAEQLDIDSDGTVLELRQRIREEYLDETKSRHSKFSGWEFLHLNRKVTIQNRMDADEFKEFESAIYKDAEHKLGFGTQIQAGDTLRVNDEEFEVTEVIPGEAHPDAPYTSYDMFMFGDRKRLMVLHDLDTSRCMYENSVVLEYATDYGPYKRWRKESYVEHIEYEHTYSYE